jgi:DNA helicase IV
LLTGVEIDDLDDGVDDNRKYKSLSHGPMPINEVCSGLEELQQKTIDIISEWSLDDDNAQATTCVMTSSHHLRGIIADWLRQQGYKTYLLEAQEPDTAAAGVIRVSTMHRAKGLEFDHVIVIDDTKLELDPRLIYVAMTRAKVRAALLRM